MGKDDTLDDSGREDVDKQTEPAQDQAAWFPFGPMFFLKQLHAFVRDRCPNPNEHLPAVEVHLADGEVLDVCHIMGLAPLWVALAVHDTDQHVREPSPMRTELVPYQIVSRVTIRSTRKELAHLGFELSRNPPMWTTTDREHVSPEEALRVAAQPATGDPRSNDKCAKHGE